MQPPPMTSGCPDEERARLLDLLLEHGILHASETQPVSSRDGSPARWMLDSLTVSLSAEGLALAGRCLLGLLERFDGLQLATYGTTAIPLLSSCILQSGGRYRGLVVRKERKAHGSRKWIEGRIDPDEPVIILDDSVSSGTTMRACRERLEEAGLRVEGGVCLVRFGWYGGFALMQEQGLHMEAVYDIWEDFIERMPGETRLVRNPTKQLPPWRWRDEVVPAGIHPATLARTMMQAWLQDGALPRPPERLDRDYDAAGGTWVSVRCRDDLHRRHAREGFWHFPGESGGTIGHDIAAAAAKTAARLPPGAAGLELLASSTVAVTVFSALQACTVGELDDDRYGIVVRSRERPGRMGGALPRMPGIVGAWQQLQHARRKNAGLVSFEPFELLRHDVVKLVEPGSPWQPTGVPRPAQAQWWEDAARVGTIASRARELVLEALHLGEAGEPPAELRATARLLDSIYVTVYIRGRLRGCMGTAVRELDDDLRCLARLAVADERFAGHPAAEVGEQVAVTVSLLFDPLDLGAFSPQEVMERVRLGQQALMVFQDRRVGMLLPFMVARLGLGPEAYALEVIDKAGITRPPYRWRRYECSTWLADGGSPRPLVGALPEHAEAPATSEPRAARLAELYAAYLVRHRADDGRLYFHYEPHQDVLHEGTDLPRVAHGAWVLARAAHHLADPRIAEVARGLVDYLVARVRRDEHGRPWIEDGKGEPSVAEPSLLLLALVSSRGPASSDALAAELAEHLWSRIDRHGRVATHRDPQAGTDAFQDYFPGQVLLALAEACRAGCSEVREPALRRAFGWYRHRYRHLRRWGQVSWQMLAFASWWRVIKEPQLADYVFEIGDWASSYQQAAGGFINDHQDGSPGYTTALYLEGLGAASRVAAAAGQAARAAAYASRYERGLQFLERLTIRAPMTTILPNPAWAIGGVRTSCSRDEVRIDFVQHALGAALERHPRVLEQEP